MVDYSTPSFSPKNISDEPSTLTDQYADANGVSLKVNRDKKGPPKARGLSWTELVDPKLAESSQDYVNPNVQKVIDSLLKNN